MLAIPVDSEAIDTKSSKLFGNVSKFALYDPQSGSYSFRDNSGRGNGIKTAETLRAWNVESVVYSYLGDGPFNAMIENDIAVYYIGSEPMALDAIVEGLDAHRFVRVDSTNASTYLDPGTATGECSCGCSHE
jgi:predicted Fe-Mo cluster-binding NifX family protein